uniref:Uncharacterized protein n=1 Tax=Vitis vinifera TaxID=29760 RepID=F6H4V6_VITVI
MQAGDLLCGTDLILPNTGMTSLDSVLTQGMNMKKKHEVEVLSAVVDSIANSVGADTIVDVGAGQVGPVLSSSVFQFCTCDPNVETA